MVLVMTRWDNDDLCAVLASLVSFFRVPTSAPWLPIDWLAWILPSRDRMSYALFSGRRITSNLN